MKKIELNSPFLGVIGDIHLGVQENQENYVNYQFESLEYHFSKIAPSTKNVLFLGDLFHNRKHVTQVTLNLLKTRFIPLLEKYEINPIFICGNHDTYFKGSNELNTLKFLLNDFYIVHDDCATLTWSGKEVACCVPWMNKENSPKLIKQFSSTSAPYLFGHFEIGGHDILPGIKCLHSNFDTESVMKFREVISGHFHCSSRHSNINYIGAPFEMNWSDSENAKQCLLLNVETGEEQYFRNPYTFYDKIQINKDKFPEIEKFAKKNIKIYLNTTRTIAIEKFITSLTEIANSVNVVDNNALLESSDAEISISKKMGILDIWQEYSEQTIKSKADKDELTKIFTETYNSVLMETVK